MVAALVDNRQRPVFTDVLGRQPKHIVFALDNYYPQPFTVPCDGLAFAPRKNDYIVPAQQGRHGYCSSLLKATEVPRSFPSL
jgi:hypothetical protein